MIPILVTGGAGYIGSHVCKALFKAGYHPIVYDNLSKGYAEFVRWGTLVTGDLTNFPFLLETVQKFAPKAVIHLGSWINVRDSILHPGTYYHNNIQGALHVLEAMVRCQIPYLLFSSTAAVYGSPAYLPIDENHPKSPLNAYGKTKWAIEQMIEDFRKAYDLSCGIFRFFNASGADSEGEVGESHDPETHLIPLVIQTALKKRDLLTIYGEDFPTPDGSALRDYVHVEDIARAHILALRFLMQRSDSFTVNLGTGKGYSVKEVIAAVEQHLQVSIPTRTVAGSDQDSPALVANASKAFEILRWKPLHSDLPTIVSSATRWEQSKIPTGKGKFLSPV